MGLREALRARRAGARAVTELLRHADELAAADPSLPRGDVATVLAAVDHSDGAAARVLQSIGLDRATLVTAARVSLAGVPGGHPSPGGDERSLLRRTSDLSGEHLGGGRFSSALVLAAAAATDHGAVATMVDRLAVARTALLEAAVAEAGRTNAT